MGEERGSEFEEVAPAEARARGTLREVAGLFLRLGFTAFGGPAAHVALMEDEVVHRRKWVDRQQFLDLVSAINFIPGPNSTELAIHLGSIRAGFPGLVVAGVCFIVPAMLIILPLGWLYVTYGQLPNVAAPLAGIRACMVAIILAALVRFAKTAVKDRFTILVAVLAAVAGFIVHTEHFRVPQGELIILAIAAVVGAIRSRAARVRATELRSFVLLPFLGAAPGGAASAALVPLILYFLKVGATLFGSGYVLVSYLRAGLVDHHRWLTAQQLTDAIAVGQVTPGPLLTTATFVGYLMGHGNGGMPTAVAWGVAATVAIFLPSFIFVALLGRMWPRLRSSPAARGALDAMNAAVVALILVVGVALAMDSIVSVWTAAVAVGSLAILLRWNVNSTWLILGSALMGVVVSFR